jgi:hypothetical protein
MPVVEFRHTAEGLSLKKKGIDDAAYQLRHTNADIFASNMPDWLPMHGTLAFEAEFSLEECYWISCMLLGLKHIRCPLSYMCPKSTLSGAHSLICVPRACYQVPLSYHLALLIYVTTCEGKPQTSLSWCAKSQLQMTQVLRT